MDAAKWAEIKRIFHEAVDLPRGERADFLSSACRGDAETRLEVEKLIASDDAGENLHDAFSPFNSCRSLLNQPIGKYKIIREIGRGGMGVVYLATREDFERQVALKIVRHEFASKEMLRRFENERRILAALEHPNIARLLDGGTTEGGLPFFVMEYVEGANLLAYCDDRNLPVNERLTLFRKVCAAVAYAHGRLIVHRDLKPSNILVTPDGEPKLLDFGISKLLDEDSTRQQTGTATMLGMMTPFYASPEQFRGESISTAADVYSLGVILYQLLTGVLPYDLNDRRLDEISRLVRETEPVKPSEATGGGGGKSRLDFSSRTNGGGITETVSPKTLNTKALRGDLDNVIMKALRKEPERRYSSVEKFSEDLRRHLRGLTVTARPDTFSYRAEKFIRRNVMTLTAAALIFLTLLAGIAATAYQSVRAERARKRAEERFGQVRALANNIVFKYYDEAAKLPNSTPMREMFVKDSLAFFDSLAQDENADESLRVELGKTFLRIASVQGRPSSPNLGDTRGAMENYRKGIEILEPLISNSPDADLQSDLVSAYADYAVVLRQNGNAAEANQIFQKSISAGEAFIRQNPGSANLASRVALNYIFWADSLPLGTGEGENIAVYRKALATCENLLKIDPANLRISSYAAAAAERTAYSLTMLARSARFDENPQLERQYLREAKILLEGNIEIGELMTRLHPNQILPPALLASARLDYGSLLIETEDYPRALEIIRKAEEFYRASMEVDPVSVGQKLEVSTVEQKLAIIYSRTGEPEKADQLFAHAFGLLDYLIEKDGENFDYVKARGEAKFDYADELLRRGDFLKARQTYQKAFDEMLEPAQKKDARFAVSLRALLHEKLGNCHLAAAAAKDESNFEKATAEYKQAVRIWKTNDVLNISGIRQDDKLAVLERKIERLENL